MEIRIKRDHSGVFKLIAEMRVKGEDNKEALKNLNNLLKSIEGPLEDLWRMGIDPEATPRTYEVLPKPRIMIVD